MEIKQLLLMKSSQVLSTIKNALQSNGYSVTGNNMWVCGTSGNGIKPFVCCHVDTVNGQNEVSQQDILISGDVIKLQPMSKLKCLGGDDRCGAYILLKLIESGVDCHFGAFQLQEVGGVGSRQFASSGIQAVKGKVSAYIELDRQGVKQFVSYNPNNELNALVSSVTGFSEARGSFSDVATLSNTTGQANVNLCVGYKGQHTKNQVIHISVMESLVGKTKALVNRLNSDGKVYKQEKVKQDDWFSRGMGDLYSINRSSQKLKFGMTRGQNFSRSFKSIKSFVFYIDSLIKVGDKKRCILFIDRQITDKNINKVGVDGSNLLMELIQRYQTAVRRKRYRLRKDEYCEILKEIIIYIIDTYSIDINFQNPYGMQYMDMTDDIDILDALTDAHYRK